MSINNVEIQDSSGNVYYPHTDASVVKFEDSDVGSALSKKVQKTTADITYYVDATNGSDTNNGLTSGTAFATIGKAIGLIPQIVNHTIIVNVSAGTYNETITLKGYCGYGSIRITGATSLADTHRINNIYVKNCGLEIDIWGFKCISSNSLAVEAWSCIYLYLQYIKTEVSATSVNGFMICNSFSNIKYCQISNRSTALLAGQLATIASRDWIAGSGNTSGIGANLGSTVCKTGTQPSGTTAESATGGGVIR